MQHRSRPPRHRSARAPFNDFGAYDETLLTQQFDRPVMVTPESARMVMETYTAADLSAERNEPIDLLSLGNRLTERGDLESVGGRAELISLANAECTRVP